MKLCSLKNAVGAVALLAGMFASSVASAALLLGAATFNTTDDLTVIKAGKNSYEFLDLSYTRGWSFDAALAEYGDDGFAVATNVDMRRLFGSFQFDYDITKKSLMKLDVTKRQAAKFSDYLSMSGSTVAVGSFLDNRFGASVACISVNNCSPRSFVSNEDMSAGGFPLIGVFLVREVMDAADVPEPASVALFSLGVAGLAGARRRRRRK